MVFTFEKSITVNSLQEDSSAAKKTSQERKLMDVIRNLKSMQGIPDEHLPTFRFF